MLPGVYKSSKKCGEPYYRASITYLGKHISLGSYSTELKAHKAYKMADRILYNSSKYTVNNYPSSCLLTFHKWVVLINVRDNKIYIKNPIYIKKRFFLYYIDRSIVLKFDVEDLFYFARHKILKRGGHLFTSEYGMQINLMSRYGIKNYAIPGRDFNFVNGDDRDFRYSNIEIINRYNGVTRCFKKGLPIYQAKIHINGDYIIGRYTTEEEAAIAYNKAANLLNDKGLNKNYSQNYIDGMDEIAYASMYQRIRISKKLREIIV
ncbi:MAG: hypothetical protein EWM47_10840 [Anaerolineaceae bacterium]|nr:MAG: hypothetical protein EWM47_10840 [Anaerolineaceae bacterium]